MYKISLKGIGKMQGIDTENSGERIVIRKLFKPINQALIIFDVGANKGGYSDIIFSELKKNKANIHLHLFEPSKENIPLLYEKLNDTDPNFITYINRVALSDNNGVANLYTDSFGSDLGSLFDLRVSCRTFESQYAENVETMMLDTYCLQNNIEHIDFLKLDVEGSEFMILRGASKLLREKKIKFIQFEFGTGNITSRTFFYDFWEMLSDSYIFYQVLKDGLIEIKKYDTSQEIFVTSNFLLKLRNYKN